MISKMFLNKRLLIFSILKTTRALIMLTLIGVIPIVCTQTAYSQVPPQKHILTCDLPGHSSCHSTGYSAGLVNRGVSCRWLIAKFVRQFHTSRELLFGLQGANNNYNNKNRCTVRASLFK